MNDTQKQKLEELQKLVGEMELGKGDVVLIKVQSVVGMVCSGSVDEITGSALLPMLNFLDDVASNDTTAATIAVKLMVTQLAGGLLAALEHHGVSSEKRAHALMEALTFPTSDPKLLAAAISTAEDFMYKLPRDVKAHVHTVISDEGILEKIKRSLA